MSCNNSNGKFKWFYSGNQVGNLNYTGWLNFCAGGPKGSGISAGHNYKKFTPGKYPRGMWNTPNVGLSQKLLDASFPFMELNWICDITLSDTVSFRVSNKNIYVEDENGIPRFYEARVGKAPSINITLGEWLSPKFEIGDLKIVLNNRDGYFNRWLPQGEDYLQWIGGSVVVKVGYGEKIANYHEVFEGIIPVKQGVTATLEEISVKCYDKFDDDQVSIPTKTFDSTNYPDVDPDAEGKSLPIVYGDWSVEVGDYGQIPAYCINAREVDPLGYVFICSENELIDIGEVYLHRGDRVTSKYGPIRLLENAITKDAIGGKITIPVGVECFSEPYEILKNTQAEDGSGLNLILSNNADFDFVKSGIQVGDTVIKSGETNVATVTKVEQGRLELSGDISFPKDSSYRITTVKYLFKKGDKISLFCKGKSIKVHSVNRIADAGVSEIDPTLLAVDHTNCYWTVDNNKKEIYKVTFKNTLEKTIKFEDIDESLDFVSGIDVQVDDSLWLLNSNNSTVYRYLLGREALGMKFSTIQISGVNKILGNAHGLTIDAVNLITIHDKVSGDFYRFTPFGQQPTIFSSFNRDDFESTANDIQDISVDVNENQLIVVDKATMKVYRVNPETGELIVGSGFLIKDEVARNLELPFGLAYSIDGTIFLMNRKDLSIYNYNEFPDVNNNPGFIARDIVQAYSGKTFYDFDFSWNQTCRDDLSAYKGRAYIDKKTTSVQAAQEVLKAYNTNMFVNFKRFALFHIDFSNFVTDGLIIREGDIKLGSFNPSKEYNQYFNSVSATYKKVPFTNTSSGSDTYISPSGVELAGREVHKTISLDPIYRRDDIDKLLPLFVRLASAEPEFINVTLGLRFLFSQPCTFFNLNFFDLDSPVAKSGRRYLNVPCFARKLQFNLDTMEIQMKLWSLGTTTFGNFKPIGVVAGGEGDEVILTNLGTAGYVAPTGIITSFNGREITIEDVGGQNAEQREKMVVGKAWATGYHISFVEAETRDQVQTVEIESVVGNVITVKEDLTFTGIPTEKNSAGFISKGHFIEYASFDQVKDEQRTNYAYFARPIEGYPLSTTDEIEEQRSGLHNFENGRLPYVLHPKDYIQS